MIGFKADEYTPGVPPSMTPNRVGRRTREEVDDVCPRHGEVQSRTDDAALSARRDGFAAYTPTYGTAVHTRLADQIRKLDDPNLRAEVSYLKGEEERYGKAGTIRIDVLEKASETTTCVYDMKAGRRGLSSARAAEIAGRVFATYPGTARILVIETRPTR